MSAAVDIILEFARASGSGEPYAFDFGQQRYLLRGRDGRFESADFPWSSQLLQDIRDAGLLGGRSDAASRVSGVLRGFLRTAGWDRHEDTICQAAKAGARITVTIGSSAAELYAVPWEYLVIEPSGQMIGSIPNLLIRYEWPGIRPAADGIPLASRRGRVLFAWSAAGGAVPAGQHVAALRDAFRGAPGAFDPARDVVGNATAEGIDAALRAAARDGVPIDALHVLCHGEAVGGTYGLALDSHGHPGEKSVVDALHMQQLLAAHASMLRMVVLAACDGGNVGDLGHHQGSVAQRIHRAGLPWVLASRAPLSGDGSVQWTRVLFESLVQDRADLESSFLRARQELIVSSRGLDWANVQLYGRASLERACYPLVFARAGGMARRDVAPEVTPMGTRSVARKRVAVLLVTSAAEVGTAVLESVRRTGECVLESGTVVEIGVLDSQAHGSLGVALVTADDERLVSETREAIQILRPGYTLYLGAAMPVGAEVRPGDTIFARKVHCLAYDDGRDLQPHLHDYQPAYPLLQRAQVEARRFDWRQYGASLPAGDAAPNAHVAPVAFVRALRSLNAPVHEWLLDNSPEAVAAMTDGEGFLSAKWDENTPTGVVCFVRSDAAEGTARARLGVARAVAAFAVGMIAQLGADPRHAIRNGEPETPINEVDAHKRRLLDELETLHQARKKALHSDGDNDVLVGISRQIDDVRRRLRRGPELGPGDVLGDRYKLIASLDRGGFATVYRAYDWYEMQEVAVKVLHPNLATNDEVRTKFFRGARNMAELTGSGAVRVTDFGGEDRGYHYFVMELIRERFRDAIESWKLSLVPRLKLVLQVGETLAAAHARGIIHRDVRPENILIDITKARLTDFDVSRLLDDTRYTRPSSVGTYIYSAPEQLNDAQDATARADLYSLAMVTVYAILGEDPDVASFQRDRWRYIQRLSCRNEIKQILARSLATHPQDRYYTSIADFCRDLRASLERSVAPDARSETEMRQAHLEALMCLSDAEFEAKVAEVEDEFARFASRWKCRSGPRALRAAELLTEAGYAEIALTLPPEASRERMSPSKLVKRLYHEADWEHVFKLLCMIDPEVFEAFQYTFRFQEQVSGPLLPRSSRAADVIELAWRHDEQQAVFGEISDFVRRFPLREEYITPSTERARASWVTARLGLAVRVLRADAPPGLYQRIEEAFVREEYSEIRAVLADLDAWAAAPLSSAERVGRLQSVLDEMPAMDGGRGVPYEDFFAVYRCLCRLPEDAWIELQAEFVVPCMSVAYACRSAQVEAFLRGVLPRMRGAVAARAGGGGPRVVPAARSLEVDVETAFYALPDELRRDLSACLDHDERLMSWYDTWRHLVLTRGVDRIQSGLALVVREFLAECGLGSIDYVLPGGKLARDWAVLLRTYTMADIAATISALHIPTWHRPAAEASFREMCSSLLGFLTFLGVPGWSDVLNAGDPQAFIRWIHLQRG